MHQQLDNLDKAKQAFQAWRASRPKKERIPGHLWDMVATLRDEYPDPMISRVLGLSHKQMNMNLETTETVTFVEAVSSNKQSTQSCDIELKRSCSAVLKITSLPISVVNDLIPSFLGQ